MAKVTPAFTLNVEQARAAAIIGQGLVDPALEAPDKILEATAFVRTIGGADAYLAVRARGPELTRAGLDQALAKGQVQVLPAARGCLYLVPKKHAPVALGVAGLLAAPRDQREHAKAGIDSAELDVLGGEVLATLEREGPLTTDALRRALPDGAIRSLGAAGKKVGISSTLPPTLRRLEFAGALERTSPSGLDTERYAWRATKARARRTASADPDTLRAQLGSIFLSAARLATLEDLAGWSGFGKRDCSAALDRLVAVPLSVKGSTKTFWTLPTLADDLRDTDPEAARAAVALLPFEDNLVALRGGPAWLVQPKFHDIEVPSWGSSRPTTLGAAKHTAYRTIVAEGRVVGFWELDPDKDEVVLGVFDKISATTKKRLGEEARRVARFLTDGVGHGRSFSLDTDEALRRRARALAEL